MQAAGDRVNRVTIMRPVETQDEAGQPISTWVVFARYWPCKIEELSGRELVRAQELSTDISLRITGPWIGGTKPKMKCVSEDEGDVEREFHIETPPINPDGRRRDMVLMCKEAR